MSYGSVSLECVHERRVSTSRRGLAVVAAAAAATLGGESEIYEEHGLEFFMVGTVMGGSWRHAFVPRGQCISECEQWALTFRRAVCW